MRYQFQVWSVCGSKCDTYETDNTHEEAQLMARIIYSRALEVCCWLPSGEVIHMRRDRADDSWTILKGGSIRNPFGA